MASMEQKRTFVKQIVPQSKNWHRKVDRMPDNQVTAIYLKEISKEQK